MLQLRCREVVATNFAAHRCNHTPNLPINFPPAQLPCPQRQQVLVDIPVRNRGVFGNHAAVEVYEDLGLGAGHLAPVLECKQLAAKRASAYHVVIRLKQRFYLLHVQSTQQLVPPVIQVFQFLGREIGAELGQELLIQTIEVDRHFQDLICVSAYELQAQLNQFLHFQELRRDQNADDVCRVERWRRVGLVQVLNEPLKDLNVTVNRNVDVVTRFTSIQV
mmetsp:Transcript_13684/g.47467  ORF Transcript_13684/g.47467 Transcript_13684/m.47467 type:complete len:220 (-) Transcript_13684:750-1409(-)